MPNNNDWTDDYGPLIDKHDDKWRKWLDNDPPTHDNKPATEYDFDRARHEYHKTLHYYDGDGAVHHHHGGIDDYIIVHAHDNDGGRHDHYVTDDDNNAYYVIDLVKHYCGPANHDHAT